MRKFLVQCALHAYIISLYVALPLMPLLASVVFLRSKYLLQYPTTLRRLLVHIAALREGPVSHYLGDVLGRVNAVPVEMKGHCVQCGNCCMDRRCMFLEQVDADKYQCGIYHSPFRRFSNCGSFPLNQHDIERYACPSYYVVEARPIHFIPYRPELQSAK